MALLSGLFNKKNNTGYTYAKMIDGSIPLYSQYGQDIYSSDVVQMSIDCIATEISKLQPKHIRKHNDKHEIPNSSLNRLFKFSPNQLMITRDFLEKVIWLLYMNYNAFIYPQYDSIRKNGVEIRREYTAFYPLNPKMVTFLQDKTGRLFVKMNFQNANEFTLPYDSVIHLRKKFSVNEIMGGGVNGQPDNTALRKVLNINDTVIEGLGKAINTSLNIRGIVNIKTMLHDDKQEAERKRFEEKLKSGESGILPLDLKSEYIDLKPDPKIIDKDTMEFLENKILYWYGVPVKILAGNFNDEEYQAFYEKTLEPLLISFGQAFSKTIFTQRELDFGNEIIFYTKNMMYLSTKSKLELLKTAGEQGLLTDNQKLKILGYPPLPGEEGSRRTISLNYISTDIADQYQLKKAGNNNLNNEGGEE
ncbi:MAG: phage portal protein [Halanaerobiales bacterium]